MIRAVGGTYINNPRPAQYEGGFNRPHNPGQNFNENGEMRSHIDILPGKESACKTKFLFTYQNQEQQRLINHYGQNGLH